MRNERFCQKTSLSNRGFEKVVQCEWPAGQTTLGSVNACRKVAVCLSVANPAGSKFEVVTEVLVHAAGGGVAFGSQPGGG